MHLFHKKNFPNNANPPAAGSGRVLGGVPGRMLGRMLGRGTARGWVSPGKIPLLGTKVSLSAPRGHFLPGTAAIRGQSALRQQILPERYLFRGQKYLSRHPEGISSRILLPFGDKVTPGSKFSRKDTLFGDKSIPPCITPCGKQCFCCF